MVAAAGSFAAVSTLLGSPIAGAFLLMEASGLGGPMLGVVLLPGLLASGVGALIFVGLDALTGFGTFSLSVPGLPHFARPDVAEFAWALVIGVAAAIVGTAIHRLGLFLRPHVERRILLLTPVVGMAIAGLTIAYTEGTGKSSSDVLFSGQSQLGPLIDHAASYSVGALLLLLACKGLAYGASLSSFRGGPTFPALYLGAAGGIALSHLPGLPLVPGVAMGIGAMCAVMLRLPLTSVLLTSLLLGSDGLAAMPLVIVAVVVAYVVSARLAPAPSPAAATARPRARPRCPRRFPPRSRPRPRLAALAHRTRAASSRGRRDEAVRPEAAALRPSGPGVPGRPCRGHRRRRGPGHPAGAAARHGDRRRVQRWPRPLGARGHDRRPGGRGRRPGRAGLGHRSAFLPSLGRGEVAASP